MGAGTGVCMGEEDQEKMVGEEMEELEWLGARSAVGRELDRCHEPQGSSGFSPSELGIPGKIL